MSQKLIVLPDHIIANYAHHPLIRSLYITDIGYFPNALHHFRQRPEGSEAYIIMYCISGEGWYRLNGYKKQIVQKGTIVVIPAHMPHEYGSSEDHPWSIYWFHMKGELASPFFMDIDPEAPPSMMSVEKSAEIIQLFNECYDLLQKGYSLNHIIYVSQLACHLAAIIRFAHLQPQTTLKQLNKYDIDRSIQFMTEHLEDNLSLKQLSAHANLSAPHFTHLFKKLTGYSPIDYYLRLKIQRACQHIDLTELSMKEISGRLGFQDPYYFSRLFKKIIGKSPSEYRNTRKG